METPQDHPDATPGPVDPPPASTPTGAPVPGWYDDPEAPGRPRWWDGQRWAAPATAPVAGDRGYAVGYGVRPTVNLVEEHITGRRAGGWLWVGLVGFAINAVIGVITIDWMSEEFERMFRAMERGGGYEPAMTSPADPSLVVANALSLVALPLIVVPGILFVIWFHRAITNARDLGLPQRLAPFWGVLGFILPIIQYWFPYWSAVDLFPAGHPGRKVVARWWAAWIGAQIASVVATVLALVGAFSSPFTPLAWGFAAVSVGLYVLAAVLARRLIGASGETHRELAEQAGVVAPGYDVGSAVQAPAGGAVVDPWAKANETRPPDPWARP